MISTTALAISDASAGGVFGGAASANQPVDTKPGRPASAVVGISGSVASAFGVQDGDDLHPAVAKLRPRRRDVAEEDIDMTADHVLSTRVSPR